MPDRWKNFSLWPHQSRAVECIADYLEACDTDASSGSALIGMPTGSGKTGIMAVTSRALHTDRSTLILVPSAALRSQVHEEVENAFWETIGDKPQDGDRSVEKLFPSNAEQVFDETGAETVYVCTVQTLSTLLRKKKKYPFDHFKSRVDQIIFDEGHREPAHKWSQAVRSMEKPTILFTATPYRNDFSYFDVNRNYTYVYSYHDAVKDGYIRKVDFKEEDFEREEDGSFSSFAEYATQFYEEEVAPLGSADEDPKVIIRCSSRSAIKGVTDALLKKGEDALAIHSKFGGEEGESFVADAPSKEDVQARFLVHQFKLVEGVDIPSIRGLIFYDGFKNARSVVQQVGRIIRNPDQSPCEKAIVRGHNDDGQKRFWNGYLQYESQHREEEDEQSIAINTKELFDNLLANQGEIQYIDREYRNAFKFDDEGSHLHEVFRYPRSVNVFRPTTESITKLIDQVKDEWEEKGFTFTDKVAKPNDNTRVVPYIIQGNSPVLRKRFFLEVRLGFFFLRSGDHHLFFYDSEGGIPSYFREEVEVEDRSHLEKLFHGDGARAQSVSLNNSDVGRDSIRRRTLHAFSIERTAPSLSDHAHFCSMIQGRARGEDESLTRRYLGLARGRVSDRGGKEEDYESYISWLEHVSETIRNENVQPADVLDRYARPSDVPEDATPTYILLDLGDILDENVYRYSDDQHLDVDEMGYEVENSDSETEEGSFTLAANENDYDVRVRYNRLTNRYTLTCEALNDAYTRKEQFSDRYKRGLISHLNIEQAFRIVPVADRKIYARGQFYRPRGMYGEGTENGIDLTGLITTVNRLEGVVEEKGGAGSHAPNNWDPTSVFGILERSVSSPDQHENCKLTSRLSGCDILVCDDMQNEVADFIAASEEGGWVSFIHVKGKMGVRSASDWQDICGQAVKNLEALSPTSIYEPPNLNGWSKEWAVSDSASSTNEGYSVDQRIRLPEEKNDPKAVWSRLRSLIRKPSVNREVWLVVGGKFSASQFRDNIQSENPRPEVINLVYLLQSTWSSVQQIGANMRIFCPIQED